MKSVFVRVMRWAMLSAVLAASLLFFVIIAPDVLSGDPGRLVEEVYVWEDKDGAALSFTDVTAEWGFLSWKSSGPDQLRAASAIVDVNNDGLNDVLLGGGSLELRMNQGDGRFISNSLSVDEVGSEVVSLGYGDIDNDGLVDLLVGTDGANDLILWGGSWSSSGTLTNAETTEFRGGRPTTGMIPADLNGDSLVDILSIGYGSTTGSEDVIYTQTDNKRTFTRVALPSSRRKSLAAEIADINADGKVDIWVTRDIGWERGADSLYMQDENGTWVDRAIEYNTNLRIDGMGVTIADFDNDGLLDSYVSDLGDNELMINNRSTFSNSYSLGLSRIRPAGSNENEVSSTWGSGAADFNLDGRLDIAMVGGGFRSAKFRNKITGTTVVVDDPSAIFLQKADGTYADIWSSLGIKWTGTSRGMSIGDLDNDGDADIVIANHNQSPTILRNDSSTKDRVTIELGGSCSTLNGGTLEILEESKTTLSLAFPGHTFLSAHSSEFNTQLKDSSVIRYINGGKEILVNRSQVPGDLITIPCIHSQ